MKRVLLILLLLPATARAEDPIEFNRDVRPILADACFKCHGLDPKARKAKLRLDVPEDAYKKRGLGYAIKPGDLKESMTWDRIASDDPDYTMPPPDSNRARSTRNIGRSNRSRGRMEKESTSFSIRA